MSLSANVIRNNLPVLNIGENSRGSIEMSSRLQRPSQSIPMEYPTMALKIPNSPQSPYRLLHQSGFLSILYSIGPQPLYLWEKQVRSGYVKRLTDSEIQSLALEIIGPDVNNTFITTPLHPSQELGIRLPILVLILKNMKRTFKYEVQIVDETKTRRRFIMSNLPPGPNFKIRSHSASLPLRLEDGWNQVPLHLGELTRKIFGTLYIETIRVQIHANCRLRRVYFCESLFGDDGLETEVKTELLVSSEGNNEEEDINYDSTPDSF